MCMVTEAPSAATRGTALTAGCSVMKDNRRESHQCRSGTKRRVRFGETVEHVFEKEYMPDEMHLIWYNGEEFHAIKQDIYRMMRSANRANKKKKGKAATASTTTRTDCDDNDDKVEESHYHWRGFEHVRQKRPRKEIRRQHVEQFLFFHKMMNVNDSIVLGSYAENNSRHCLERARELAIMDENEAFEIYKEEPAATVNNAATTTNLSNDATTANLSNDATFDHEANNNNINCVSVVDKYAPPPQQSPMEEEKVEVNHAYKEWVAGMSICREDTRRVHLLHPEARELSMVEHYENTLAMLVIAPYKLAVMLFPCVC